MSDIKARQLFQQFKTPSSSSGTTFDFDELRQVYRELSSAEGDKPAGQFSPAGRALVDEIVSLPRGEQDFNVRRIGALLKRHVQDNAWQPPVIGDASEVLTIAAKNDYEVFLTTGAGFAIDATGEAASSVQELGNALYSAGEWVQASFGSGKNLFSQPGFDNAGKLAVVSQFSQTATSDLSNLSRPERDQILGNIAGLLVELVKSANLDMRAPVAASGSREMVNAAFKLLTEVLNKRDLSALVRRQLVAYLAESDSFRGQLTGAQRTEVDAIHTSLNPKAPFDYAKWDAAGKDTIVVKHLAGGGEGFLYGIGKWLQEKGIGASVRRDGQLKAELVSGTWDDDRGPVSLKIDVPESSPYNKWGRPMTVQIELSDFRNNMFEGLGDQNVDITGYDGHSGFGRNTLKSLPSAPAEQVGDKLFYRFVCAGVDAENAIAQQFPEAYVNSYTTQDSGYFWKTDRPAAHGGGEYAYRSEGWMALGNMILGVLGKQDHAGIQSNMKRYANMARHSPGNDNNFVGPGDARRGGSADYDGDGRANMYDVMPTINTFNVDASAANEFDMALPDLAANKIKGGRAFQAVQFVDTATNYTTLLKKHNLNRKMQISPNGPFFDGADDPKTYVRFQRQGDEVFVQFNSALSDMTMESLRAVLYFESSKFLLGDGNGSPEDKAENVAAALMFAASSLEYDMGWRDEPVFAGLKTIYNIPDDVDYASFRSALRGAEERHNYSGDSQALRSLMAAHGDSLAQPGVGQPAIATA